MFESSTGGWTRTSDLLRVTQALPQLSYTRLKWTRRDLNPRPPACKAGALAI